MSAARRGGGSQATSDTGSCSSRTVLLAVLPSDMSNIPHAAQCYLSLTFSHSWTARAARIHSLELWGTLRPC